MMDRPLLIQLTSPDGRLGASVAPTQGGELCSLAWEGRELLYRGGDFAPTSGWTGRAPILWPAIGRTFAPETSLTADNFREAPLGWRVGGRDYPMPMHGFAKSVPWLLDSVTATTARLILTDSNMTRDFYPFGFRHTLDYTLADGGLTLRHEVAASPSNMGRMPFALGNHATFNLPLVEPRSPDAVKIVTNCDRRIGLDPTGRPTGDTTHCELFTNERAVTAIERFEVIALRSDRQPGWARLRQGGLSITVSHGDDATPFEPLKRITLWGDPAAGYVSLEAWLGEPNALSSGRGLCRLAPGEAMEWKFAIVVSDNTTTRPSADSEDRHDRV